MDHSNQNQVWAMPFSEVKEEIQTVGCRILDLIEVLEMGYKC